MASLFNHSDFWHTSGEVVSNALLNHVGKHILTFSWIQGIILSVIAPVIIISNGLVIYTVWKDPLKNLRNASPNFILQSMAVTDLLVGLVLAPVDAYWLLTIAVADKMPFSFHAIYSLSTTFLGASFAHVLLLSTLSHLQSVMNPFVFCWRLPRYRQVWRHYIQPTGQCCTRIKRRCRGKENCSFDTKL